MKRRNLEECPLCAYSFIGDRVTGEDATPYARAYAQGLRGWWEMNRWVWTAGLERLRHLALMRASAASRRYLRRNILFASLVLGVVQGTVVGWRTVSASPTVEPSGSTSPAGCGWRHLTGLPIASRPSVRVEQPVDLWWNPTQGYLALLTTALFGAFLMGIAGILGRSGVRWAYQAAYRPERRMTAALHYGSAWLIPIILVALLMLLRPLSFVGLVRRWPMWNGPAWVDVPVGAAVIGGLGLWWFWLVRLASTAPPRTRNRVVVFMSLGVPLLSVALVAAGYVGLHWFLDRWFDELKLRF